MNKSHSINSIAKISLERNKTTNKIEDLKSQTDFIKAYEKLEYYAKNGYASIDDEAKKFILKSFGIFDRPATPKQFMLRVRIKSGRINIAQAVAIANIAKEYGKDYIDITTRMQIELRFLKIEDIPSVLSKLDAVGITTFQTGVDNFRNILTDPLDGFAKDNIIECANIVQKMQDIFLKKPEWITTLPRKFNAGISGSTTNRCNIFGQDCAFVLAKKNDIYGFNIYLGGKVGKIAKCANIFVAPDEVLSVFVAIIELFKEYGFRDNRNKNRLFFLLEAVGINTFGAAIRERAGIDFMQAGELCNEGVEFEQKGSVLLKKGTVATHCAIPAGIFSGTDLLALANQCSENSQICFTVEQNLYIIGEKEQNSIEHKFINYTNNYLTNIVACAGSEHCPFGVIENKSDAIKLAEYLGKNIEFTKPLRMCWSACPKGCGIHAAGDIGFVGTKKAVDGKICLAVDIYTGAKLNGNGHEGQVYAKGILLSELNEFVAKMLK
ncbi:MAG: hypothetical protein RL154_247 [Pseudomonadota bacterium]